MPQELLTKLVEDHYPMPDHPDKEDEPAPKPRKRAPTTERGKVRSYATAK